MFKDIKFYFKKSGLVLAFFNVGLYSLILYRVGHWLYSSRLRKINPFWYLYLIAASFLRVLTKIELPCDAEIGQRLFFPHPYGLVCGKVKIGDDCVIGPWVVLGHLKKDGCPQIGNNVYIGSKSTVLGNIKIGDNCIIGASSVVVKDMPENAKAKAPLATIVSTKLQSNNKNE